MRFGKKALALALLARIGVSGKTGAAGTVGPGGRLLKSDPRGNPVAAPATWVWVMVPPKLAPTMLEVRFNPSRAKAMDQPPRITVCPALPVRLLSSPDLKFGWYAKPIVGAKLCAV